MVFHTRCMPEHIEGNLMMIGLEIRATTTTTSFSIPPINEGGVGCAPKVPQCPTSIRNGKSYEYISIDNIKLGENPKNKIMRA